MFGVGMETGGKQVLSPESAAASGIYDQFVTAQTFKSILGTFRLLCDTLRIKPTNFPNFYPKLKAKLRSWKVQALWSKFEKRASHKCYNRGKACANTKVLIIGAGPCGLRAAIEAQLLGAKVVVIEKRDRFSRNNVLHLWPFVIHDLRNLGAKKFYGKFCAGTIDHISIRQLQCILLKVALLLGVEVHEGVVFDDLIQPPLDQSQEKIGWRARLIPRDHPVSQYEFDVVIGADGKRNTLTSFKRKEFRGKLAIAITANFINRHTEAEARVQEISGVAFIFNQKFFQDLKEYTGIDLENIVYYKDETHYFVMTAKKSSLIEKGVILNDYPETEKLLSIENVNREALLDYAREAADFSTNFQLPNLDFAVNHYGQADVAMFDFTSMFAAESACRIVELRGHKLLQCLVGDSLLEPFWPTGSGCARGFLSSMDACWMIRNFALGMMTPLQVLAERESAYRLLAQTTHENLNKDFDEYSLNPASRYPNLNSNAVRPAQVKYLYDTDRDLKDEPIENYELPKKRKKKDTFISSETLLNWCQRQVLLYKNIRVENMTTSWKNGMVLCAIIHRYRPDLIDFNMLDEANAESNIQLAFDVCEREYGVLPVMTAKEMAESVVPDSLSVVAYVSQIYDVFRGQIPHIARAPLTDISPEDRPASPIKKISSGRLSILSRIGQRITQRKRYPVEDKGTNLEVDVERELAEMRRAKKRMSLERDRALFILNKDMKQPVLTSMKKLEPTFEDREQFSSRVKDLEEKLYGSAPRPSPQPSLKKVGKISQSDWNVKMLEEKLKGTKPEVKKDRQEVPKWSKDIFEEKLKTMDMKSKCEEDEGPVKFTDFDMNLRMLDKKLKEGNNLDTGQRGMNKVSAMAEQISGGKATRPDSLLLQKSNVKPMEINFQQGSELCYFCKKRVYLMERQSAQGKFFHRGCFKCECCHIALRLGNYGVGTEEPYIGKFLCLHHFSMRPLPKKRPSPTVEFDSKKVARVVPTKIKVSGASPEGGLLDVPTVGVAQYRGLTPERVEFENTLDFTSEEELLSEIDEDEWTDRNFGMSANEYESTDSESEISSDDMADEEREELEKAYKKSFGGTSPLSENLKKWFTKSGKSKVKKDLDEEDSEEGEYAESEEEYSYEEYENEEGESTPTEGETPDVSGTGPIEKAAKECEKNGELNSQTACRVDRKWEEEYQTLQSNDETCSDELQSNSSDGEDYTDESETETDFSVDDELDRTEDDSDRLKIKHEIPSIVIDETTVTAPNDEDDSYFEALQQQNMEAEKTLEDLIRGGSSEESAIQTPCTPLESYAVVEDMQPLVKYTRNPDIIDKPIRTDAVNRKEDKMGVVAEDKVSESVDAVKHYKTLPRDIGKSRRPISLIETTEKLDTTDKKFGSVTDVNRTKQFTDESGINKMDSVSSLSKRKSSLESASSLPDLDKTKPSERESIGGANKLTESPTAKMMLKLKERYLLGSSNDQETITTTPETTTKIEPVVKSLLDLISEKQKMLSPATSPSPVQHARSFNYNETSPSPTSNSSTPSVSESSRVSLSNYFSWSAKQSPIASALSTNKNSVELAASAVKINKVSEEAMNCDKTLSPYSNDEIRQVINETPPSLLDNEPSDEINSSANAECDHEDDILKQPLHDNDTISSLEVNQKVDESLISESTNVLENNDDKLQLDFKNIDSSNITIRKQKYKSLDSDKSETEEKADNPENISSVLEEVAKKEESALQAAAEKEPIIEIVAVVQKVEEAVVENEAIPQIVNMTKEQQFDDDKTDEDEKELFEEIAIKGKVVLQPEDDDLMGMLSNSDSSSSDSTPSLDESIYHPKAADTKSSQRFAAYVGSLASRGITFGGVRDSIDVRKSALKRSPIKMGVGHSHLLGAAIIEAAPPEVTSFPPATELEKGFEKVSSVTTTEEIPFADEESSSQESEKNTKKKSPLRYTPSTPIKRPTFEKSFSMIEMRSSSFPSLIPKGEKSFEKQASSEAGTPDGNMSEDFDDLRMLRTVEREKARQLARERARLKSDEELGIKGLDYSKLRKKYQKGDDSPSHIREESNFLNEDVSLESTSEETTAEQDNELMEEVDITNEIVAPVSQDVVEDLGDDKAAARLTESSSPDSDVFERCSPVLICSNEDLEEPRADKSCQSMEETEEIVVNNKTESVDELATKSASEGSEISKPENAASLSSTSDEPGAPLASTVDESCTASSEEQPLSGASTTSKTDFTSYLEPDLSIRELKSHQFSPEDQPKNVDKSAGDNGAKSKSNSLPGLLSKKDKGKKKSTSPAANVEKPEKQKSKEKKSLLSLITSLTKSDSAKSKSKERGGGEERDNKKEKSPSPSTASSPVAITADVPLQGAGIKVDGTPKESRFHKLRLSRSKDKDKRKQKSQSIEVENASPSHLTSPLSPTILASTSAGVASHSKPKKYVLGSGEKAAEITLDKHALIASMAFISKSASATKVSNGSAPKASEDSFSDVEEENSQATGTVVEISEERRKKYEKMMLREQRLQEQKRLRAAQEIQRQLEELEVKQKSLELRGVEIEKALRGERSGADGNGREQELLQEWLYLMQTKNNLIRHEHELMVKAKELELEDRHARLKARLYKLMQIEDSKKTDEQLEEEGKLLTEAYEIVNQRDNLIMLLEETRHLEEDVNAM